VRASCDGGAQERPDAAPRARGGENSHEYDFLVIGSGIAGLTYALKAARHGRVAVVTKAHAAESSTKYAQGGISAVWDPADSVESHVEDTHVAGAFLCDERAVEVVCTEGPERVRELIALGAEFSRAADGSGAYHLAKEGGHTHSRILHAADMTGREIERALLKSASENEAIDIFEHSFATELLTVQGSGVGGSAGAGAPLCIGADAISTRTGEVTRFLAHTTLVASGGAGQVYPSTTNPPVATGDGMALCMRAGAPVTNLEFVQFHPTSLYDEATAAGGTAFLITEAMRGAGGLLYNTAGERFMPSYDARAELAPRDVVARAIDDQLKCRGDSYVLLDISHKPAEEILDHFPNIAAYCKETQGLDITKDPIPVVPAAHYFCGGVSAGLDGETAIAGLFTCGEAACTGLHGANRLASNSLLEGLVFAHRAAEAARAHVRAARGTSDTGDAVDLRALASGLHRPMDVALSLDDDAEERIAELRGELTAAMWDHAGIVRNTESLRAGLERVACVRSRAPPAASSVSAMELHNLLDIGEMIVRSALQRRESRGLHYTKDHPAPREKCQRPTTMQLLLARGGDGSESDADADEWLVEYYNNVRTDASATTDVHATADASS